MPLRSVKMKGRMRGSQRRVWWPKWTPASSSVFICTGAGIGCSSRTSVSSSAVAVQDFQARSALRPRVGLNKRLSISTSGLTAVHFSDVGVVLGERAGKQVGAAAVGGCDEIEIVRFGRLQHGPD